MKRERILKIELSETWEEDFSPNQSIKEFESSSLCLDCDGEITFIWIFVAYFVQKQHIHVFVLMFQFNLICSVENIIIYQKDFSLFVTGKNCITLQPISYHFQQQLREKFLFYHFNHTKTLWLLKGIKKLQHAMSYNYKFRFLLMFSAAK